MNCPYCKKEMEKGRIIVPGASFYSFLPEEYFESAISRIINKVVIGPDDRVTLSKWNLFGNEIKNCYYCPQCRKIVICLDK